MDMAIAVSQIFLAFSEGGLNFIFTCLPDSHTALNVNWCELTLTRESDGKLLYQNAFATNHELTAQTLPLVTAAGRCRWKTENENHNVLKTKGYHLEHNFGHGQTHLAAILLTLNLLAFLFHTAIASDRF
jgi:hypothetical protein